MPAQKRDYYETLGLPKNSTPEQIKQAYKEFAKKFHPDINKEQGAEEKFKEVLEAYSVLSDPKKRADFDNYGFNSPEFSNFDVEEFMKRGGMHFDFSDLFGDAGFDPFEQFFRVEKKQSAQRGFDLRFDLELELEDAVLGIEKTIEFVKTDTCDECNGTGSRDKEVLKCPQCNGKGVVERAQKTPFGVFATRMTCNKCNGAGAVVKNPCKKCNGSGQIRVKKKISVKIPMGIENGSHLRLKGEGNAGSRGGLKGDLYVVVLIKPHKIFKRDGADLFVEVPISFAEAALGGEVEVPTINAGTAKLKLPAGTQSGTLFKLRGLGVKEQSGIGDLFVKAIVKTPSALTLSQREAFEKLSSLDGFKERQSFFDSLKKKFKK